MGGPYGKGAGKAGLITFANVPGPNDLGRGKPVGVGVNHQNSHFGREKEWDTEKYHGKLL